jgi:hypothetical protein
LTDVETTSPLLILDEAARGDDLFVQSEAVAPDHDEPGMRNHSRRIEDIVGNDTSGDALKFRPPFFRPHFGPQQPQAHLRQAVIEMDQHHVVSPPRHRLIECDGSNFSRVRMFQTFRTGGPTSFEWRQPITLLAIFGLCGNKGRLTHQR